VNWIVPTKSDLDTYLVGAQAMAVRTAALAPGQSDTFAAVMQDRCNYVRNRISRRIQISATAYAIPPELKTTTLWLIIEALQGRLPTLALSEDQRRMIDRAYRDLEIAGTDDLPVSTPDDPTSPSVQASGGIEVVREPTRRLTRESLDGL
jgi:hypothetical protein